MTGSSGHAFAQAAEHLLAVHVGQHQIKQHQVTAKGQRIESGGAGGRVTQSDSFARENLRKQPHQLDIVIDQQHGHGRGGARNHAATLHV